MHLVLIRKAIKFFYRHCVNVCEMKDIITKLLRDPDFLESFFPKISFEIT